MPTSAYSHVGFAATKCGTVRTYCSLEPLLPDRPRLHRITLRNLKRQRLNIIRPKPRQSSFTNQLTALELTHDHRNTRMAQHLGRSCDAVDFINRFIAEDEHRLPI